MITRVLIADDEEIERRAIGKILEDQSDLEVLEAENGIEALALVERVNVTVAILDIKMPGLDGIAVAETLRQNHPDVAVVFLTAYDQFDYARSALRLQVDDFLLKPASADEVTSTIRRVLARVASREDERESSRAALMRLDNAIHMVAQRLRQDLSEGLPDLDQVRKFLELQGLVGHPQTLLECRPAQPSSHLGHAARLAEALFSVGDTVALAGVRDQTVRILRMGSEEEFLPLLQKFREVVRTETGCTLLVGVATATPSVHLDAQVAVAHRAATVASTSNPVIAVSLDAEGLVEASGARRGWTALPPTVTKALAILEARLAEDLSLNEVASLVGLSASHLSRLLARATGNGFADCLAQFRIEEAKKHLNHGTLTVKEVAHLVGFHDPAYFARVFRRLEGRSPADFRSAARRPEAS